jgi:hypothetical protein
MPMKLTVGVTKKLGLPAYSSVGASCTVEVELDGTLFQDLDGFRSQVRAAYDACRQAVHDELARLQVQVTGAATLHSSSASDHDRQAPSEDGRGNTNESAPAANGAPVRRDTSGGRPFKAATPSQVKAICAIARSQHADLEGLLRHDYGVNQPEELSLVQASDLIDRLRAVGSA